MLVLPCFFAPPPALKGRGGGCCAASCVCPVKCAFSKGSLTSGITWKPLGPKPVATHFSGGTRKRMHIHTLRMCECMFACMLCVCVCAQRSAIGDSHGWGHQDGRQAGAFSNSRHDAPLLAKRETIREWTGQRDLDLRIPYLNSSNSDQLSSETESSALVGLAGIAQVNVGNPKLEV